MVLGSFPVRYSRSGRRGQCIARPLVAVLASVVLSATSVSSAAAYTYDTYASFYVQQSTNYYCVPASALMNVDYITGSRDASSTTQDAYYTYARNHDKEPHTSGTDPRGWAWDLYHWSPPTWGFNDYKYASQASADGELEMTVRLTGKPAGALVATGHHAFNVVGFQASSDPSVYPPASALYGFYAVDPWYGRPGDPGLSQYMPGPWPVSPNTYKTLSTWNSNYFGAYAADEGTQDKFWHGQYVIVVRAPTTNLPSDAQATGNTWADNNGGLAPVQVSTDVAYPYGNVSAAVVGGLQQNELTSHNSLGLDLSGVAVLGSIHVDSLVAEFPSYELVALGMGSKPIAVALLTDQPDGLHFAELAAVGPSYHLPSVRDAQVLAGSRLPNVASARLVWAWPREGGSPFVPFFEVPGITPHWLFADGTIQSVLDLTPGLHTR